jgi:hypothetical protein
LLIITIMAFIFLPKLAERIAYAPRH